MEFKMKNVFLVTSLLLNGFVSTAKAESWSDLSSNSFNESFLDSVETSNENEMDEWYDIEPPQTSDFPQQDEPPGKQQPKPSSPYRWPAPGYRPYSKEWVSQEIEKGVRASITKDGAFCKLEGVNTKSESFVAQFSTGVGNNLNAGSGNGTVIVNSTQNPTPQPYIGVTLTFTKTNCTQTVLVPVIDYRVFAAFKASLLDENGSPVRTLTPAQQTILLFFTTLAKQATGCQTTTR
jgi:hypothetical protein